MTAFMNKMNSKQLFDDYRQQLQDLYSPAEAQNIAFWLMEHFFELSRTQVLVNSPIVMDEAKQQALSEALIRLKHHEPI